MIIEDRVYGKHHITERVLMDLINSKAIQRLKGIAQYGVPDEWYHIKGFSRYEHSAGVLILLDRLKAGTEEKIAGILHDVSHTAFSHVIDWVYGSEHREDFQDRVFSSFMDSPEIKKILGLYGFRTYDFHDLKKFTLLEQEIPDICVDRLDYSLREMKINGLDSEVDRILGSLVNIDGKIYIRGEGNALLFATQYLKLQKEHWGGGQARNRYRILADVLRTAIDENVVSFDDMLKDDKHVMNKLLMSGNPRILQGIAKLTSGSFEMRNDLPKKFRYVDPLYVNEYGVVKRLSEINRDFALTISQK